MVIIVFEFLLKNRMSSSEHSRELGGRKVGVKEVPDTGKAAASGRRLPEGLPLDPWGVLGP